MVYRGHKVEARWSTSGTKWRWAFHAAANLRNERSPVGARPTVAPIWPMYRYCVSPAHTAARSGASRVAAAQGFNFRDPGMGFRGLFSGFGIR